jgi:ElaB/YqjD/DUF883 family membrane-anchored ribosome-binding protein
METIKNSNSEKMAEPINVLRNKDTEVSFEVMYHNAGNRLGTVTSELANSANEYAKSSRKFVVENPVKGVAIAAATGAVVGSLITLAMRKRH